MLKSWRPFTQMKLVQNFPRITHAKGSKLYLENGKALIDATSSWWVTIHGHADPEIAEAIAKQAAKLEHVIYANFSHEPAEELLELLYPLVPKTLTHAFFSDNGSTSVEVALKMSLQYWNNLGSPRKKFLAFEGAYHGDTLGCMSVSARSAFTAPFESHLFKTDLLPYPQTEQSEKTVLIQLETLLQTSDYAALIIEPLVQGVAGMKMCRPEFLLSLHKLLKQYQVLCIYDEVMTGFGRTGELFACRGAKTMPDLLCLAKGITGGFLPLGLTLCSNEIFDAFYSDDRNKTFYHGHSYTGNPLSCAAAVASLKKLTKDRRYMPINKLHKSLSKRIEPYVNNLRIKGTICAFELKSDRESDYFNQEGEKLQKHLFEKGIFLRPLGNTFFLLPPYCITEEELEIIYREISTFLSGKMSNAIS